MGAGGLLLWGNFVEGLSHQVVEGGVHGVQVVAALPVLDSLHSWVVRVEPLVQVLWENLVYESCTGDQM